VSYDERRFNKKNEVFFDIVRTIPNERCYFCHSSKWVDEDKNERWQMEEDVHLNAGMLCVDCHRNGLDHKMVRGYENNPLPAASLTCAGCHMPKLDEQDRPLNGRLGAPVPEHEGLPVIHFEKLACTTCHSGIWPKDINSKAKTSMAHKLGLHSSNKSNQALPHIVSPVFTKRGDGKYAPHNMIWPSYWAEMDSNRIVPLKMSVFLPVTRKIIGHIDSLGTNDWPQIEDSTLVKALDSLYKNDQVKNPPVYVTAGKVFFLNQQKQLQSREHESAHPYKWPIAHDVRPAAQSLGVNGCKDCHSPASNFAFGDIIVDTPLKSVNEKISMNVFLEQNIAYENIFATTFYLRPFFKWILGISWIIITFIILIYALKGLSRLLRFISSDEATGSNS